MSAYKEFKRDWFVTEVGVQVGRVVAPPRKPHHVAPLDRAGLPANEKRLLA